MKVCVPSLSGPVLDGDAQTAKTPLSSLHWKLEPVSLLVKANCGLALLESAAGVAVSEVLGAVRSTVQL